MTAPGDRDTGGFTAPSLEEVAAKYDQFTDLYGLTAGDIGIHIGMWSRPGERAPASTLFDLANLAQERQTEYHIETLGLKTGERLLDVGCGTGVPAVRMAQHSGALVTGINISREQLTRAEAAARSAGVSDRVSFRYGNAMALDFPDESFDAVMAIDVYDHLSDRQKAFHETARVLRPGGHFMMSDFTLRGTPDEAELAAYTQGWSSMPPGTPAQTIAAAANAGFELIKAENMTQNCVFSGELMGLLYADRHDEIVERYGPEIVAQLDAAMPVMRTFIRDHLGYYLFLLRKPAVG
ncbi:MAG TPA: class I SAM-dependent methyltransferase [Actinophytocola sp.]|uniref:class I SAM-dependent methyltransferase n=1 Tax=Actinophytocola sp. TaxID=1872138 RepID=UPI002DBF0FE7|nr:class I SAM-dependent methyltransferase [Actinophytocola sp.]HEU5471262.1 class I SAM-dependent methyltransferase [Actinophytocola sp.]